MRILMCVCAIALLLSMPASVPAQSAASVQIVVNRNEVNFSDVQPYIDTQTQSAMVPVKLLADQLGAKVQWDGALRQVRLVYQDKSMVMTIGQNKVEVNGQERLFDAPAVIKDERTVVPLRFISEWLGAKVDWIAERNVAVITTPGSGLADPAGEQVSDVQKGTWIWETRLLADAQSQEQIVQFGAANDLTTFFLHYDSSVPASAYQSFIRRAADKQIKVEALIGSPALAFTQNQDQIKKFLIWVKAYNASVQPNERFQGLHFDIEPYTLGQWKTDNELVVDNWMNNMRLIETESRGTGLPITADVPFWLHQTKLPGSDYSLTSWMLEKFDRLVIMDYRNTALGKDGIIDNAKIIMRQAATLKKKAVVAVETAPSTESSKTTFHSFRFGEMKAELDVANAVLSSYESYGGFAIHDYKHWMSMSK